MLKNVKTSYFFRNSFVIDHRQLKKDNPLKENAFQLTSFFFTCFFWFVFSQTLFVIRAGIEIGQKMDC